MPRSKNNEKNITKESHAFYMTHEAFFLLQALGKQDGITTAAYLETLLRREAKERLKEEERAAILQAAEEYTAQRRAELQKVQAKAATT